MRRAAALRVVGTAVALVGLALAAPAPAAPPGLVAAYDFNTGAQTTPDSSGNGLDAARFGAPAAVPDGHVGGAFRFTAAKDAYTAPVTPLLQTPAITVAAWVRSASTPTTVRTVLAHGASGGCSHASYALYTGGSSQTPGLRFYIWNGTVAPVSPAAPNTMWNGAWHHVAGTYDGASVRLYVDGAQVGTGTPASGPIAYGLAGSNRLAIGNYAGNLSDPAECIENTAFGADIDEVRVFNRALSAQEIGAVLTGVDPAPPPGDPGTSKPPPTGPAPADGDGDGVPDAADVCPGVADPGQADADGDRIGDACEVLPSGAREPVAGQRVAASIVAGSVLVRLAPGRESVPLAGVASLPVGAIVDARKGRLDLRAAGRRRARIQSARIAAGIFQIRQARARRGADRRDRPRAADPGGPGTRLRGGGSRPARAWCAGSRSSRRGSTARSARSRSRRGAARRGRSPTAATAR